MGEQTAGSPEAVVRGSDVKAEAPKRFQSEIEFPYADLDATVELARKLHERAGTSCEDDELAAWLNQSSASGTYRSRRSAARQFGLIDIAQGRIALTELGRKMCDPQTERFARAEAFLGPELFRQMYEAHKGHVLPPAAAIERQMEQMGVSPKQKERARQVFQKSAIQAGYIDPTTGRFVKPGMPNANALDSTGQRQDDLGKDKRGNGGSGAGGALADFDLDPLLIELLKKIPTKQEGWEAAKRVRWFRTFAMNVSQIYDSDDAPVELQIVVAKTSE